MGNLSCKNCTNLKTRLVAKSDVDIAGKKSIRNAIKNNSLDELGLGFPFSWVIYKRIVRYGECRIIYCSEGILPRDVYIYRDNSDKIAPQRIPCIRYK